MVEGPACQQVEEMHCHCKVPTLLGASYHVPQTYRTATAKRHNKVRGQVFWIFLCYITKTCIMEMGDIYFWDPFFCAN